MSTRHTAEIPAWSPEYRGVQQEGSTQATEQRSISPYSSRTSAEVLASIDAGREPQPDANSVLCADGWLTFR